MPCLVLQLGCRRSYERGDHRLRQDGSLGAWPRNVHASHLHQHARLHDRFRSQGTSCCSALPLVVRGQEEEEAANSTPSHAQEAHDSGCRNILALRGDPPRGSEEWTQTEGGFNHAIDLIRHIRAKYGDYFCIGVRLCRGCCGGRS